VQHVAPYTLLHEGAERLGLAVIVVTFNSERSLGDCLKSIRSETEGMETEIVVIDNASEDATVNVALASLPREAVIALNENLGFSTAVNLGISKTKGEYVLLVNPDVVLQPGCLRSMSSILESDATVGAVGAKHRYPNGGLQLTWGWAPTLLREWFRKKCQYGLRARNEKLTERLEKYTGKNIDVDWVSGSCLLFRRCVNEDLSGWDENFFLFFEDIDWCVRARKQGCRVVYCSDAVVTHLEGASAATRPKESERAYRQSQRLYARKHWGLCSRTVLNLYLTLEGGR